MKNVLITGAGGYVGTVMCGELIKLGYNVFALDRYYFGKDKLNHIKSDNLHIIQDDIRYFSEEYLNGIDIIIDLAGLSNDATAEIDAKFTKEINCEGAIRLANLAKKYKIKQYIYSSSASVYGAGLKNSLKETDTLNPLTDYAKSKVSVEKVLIDLQSDDFKVTILRNATIYGLSPRMRFDLAINIMTLSGYKDGIVYIMGDGEQWRPFVHVKDVVSAFILCIDNENAYNQIFNVGSNNQNFKIKDIAEKISRQIKNCKVIYIPNNPDVRTYNLNFDKIYNVLGFETEWTLNMGVSEIKKALINLTIKDNDPTHHTLKWYQNLISWDKIITEVKSYDKIL